MADILVVTSKIKKIVKDAGLRTGADYLEGLSSKVDSLIKESIGRVQSDGKKKTLGLEDL
ncbi:hypothetical protein ACFL6Y_11400 [Elusimicrobiota bacterium]